MTAAVIVGSAFSEASLGGVKLEPLADAPEGMDVRRFAHDGRGAPIILFRHGAQHGRLPNQIPYREQARFLSAYGCTSLLVTSSVGVLDASVPLAEPLLVRDILMLDNRLPDGSACTVFDTFTPGQGHLVVDEGLLNVALSAQVAKFADQVGRPISSRVTFSYAPGPRTKTAAENRALAAMGAQVASMTLAPEVVLANELGIPTAALVVGHKYSTGAERPDVGRQTIDESLRSARNEMEAIIELFLRSVEPVLFRNRLHRLDE